METCDYKEFFSKAKECPFIKNAIAKCPVIRDKVKQCPFLSDVLTNDTKETKATKETEEPKETTVEKTCPNDCNASCSNYGKTKTRKV